MVEIPKPVLQALYILQSQGIQAEIFPMYGTEHIHFVIALPKVEIKEINETKNRE